MDSTFSINVSLKGQMQSLQVTTEATPAQLFCTIREAYTVDASTALKILYKGKSLNSTDVSTVVFSSVPTKTPKLIVMASSQSTVKQIQEKRSDPTIRGFDNERKTTSSTKQFTVWGTGQDPQYRFVRIEPCNEQDFGHRARSSTPHAFQARQLLEKMATDPGVVAIMRERKLVVNTLGEMDPIDDRLMQQKEAHGGLLLGYNTNHGLAIHIRLRTLDLNGFLPYPQLISTLIHELSHNWVGDHNLLFWGNFAQMRVEYLHTHARLAAQGSLAQGKATAVLAEVCEQCRQGMSGIAEAVVQELAHDLPQYGLTPQPLVPAILDRCRQLTEQYSGMEKGRALGGGTSMNVSSRTARQAALEAAERRARESRQNKDMADGKSKK